jgi:hypothetical protein
MSTATANALLTDLGTVDDRIRSGVTAQRAKAMENHWTHWYGFCLELGVDPYLRRWEDPVPLLQVFGERYRDSRLVPRGNAVRARAVEDAMCAVGQTFTKWGSPDVRKDVNGDIDLRIGRQISAYKKEDSTPKRVKPIPITIIIFIMAQAFGQERDEGAVAILDMITITLFYLLRAGEYTGTTSDRAAFCIEDVALYIQDLGLDSKKTAAEKAAYVVAYTFTTHKNGRRNEKLVHGRSGDSVCCPVRVTAHHILYQCLHKFKSSTPLAAYYQNARRVPIKAKDVTDVLRLAMTMNFDGTCIAADEVSTRSLRVCGGGAMALLIGQVDMYHIRILGRWYSEGLCRSHV